MESCWLAENALVESSGSLVPLKSMVSLRDCDGPIDPVHLIPRQLLKRELGHPLYGFEMVTRGSCRRHHHLFDVARKLRIPREALPHDVESFAADTGLEWYLDRTYGEREAAA